MITKRSQLIIRFISTPVNSERYLSGPSSLAASLFTLASRICVSRENIESFTTSSLVASLSFSLAVDSMFRIAELFVLTTRLPFLSVN